MSGSVVFRMGRLYGQMDRSEKAAETYQQFITAGSSLPAHHCRFIAALEKTDPELQPRVKPQVQP